MNAPLPIDLSKSLPDHAYDKVAHISNEVAGLLAKRLRSDTRGEVLFSAADRGRYATDASIYQAMPLGVFVPRDASDVRVALDICRDLGVPIVPRGGGTSQCGQTVGAGLVIDHSKHMRQVLAVDPEQRTATVEPGLVLDHLNAALKQHGLWYPVDVSTSAQATLGGMAGNNSCGSRSIAYGNMVHNVAGAKAWLSDGTLVDWGRYADSTGRARRRVECSPPTQPRPSARASTPPARAPSRATSRYRTPWCVACSRAHPSSPRCTGFCRCSSRATTTPRRRARHESLARAHRRPHLSRFLWREHRERQRRWGARSDRKRRR